MGNTYIAFAISVNLPCELNVLASQYHLVDIMPCSLHESNGGIIERLDSKSLLPYPMNT